MFVKHYLKIFYERKREKLVASIGTTARYTTPLFRKTAAPRPAYEGTPAVSLVGEYPRTPQLLGFAQTRYMLLYGYYNRRFDNFVSRGDVYMANGSILLKTLRSIPFQYPIYGYLTWVFTHVFYRLKIRNAVFSMLFSCVLTSLHRKTAWNKG